MFFLSDMITITKSLIQYTLFELYPTLFPLMLLSNILISSKIIHNLCYYLNSFTSKYMQISSPSLIIYILSIITGYPSQAKLIDDALKEGLITIQEANYLCFLTYHGSYSFIYMISNNLIIYICHIVPTIIMMLLVFPNCKHSINKCKMHIDIYASMFSCVRVLIIIFACLFITRIIQLFLPINKLIGFIEFSTGCILYKDNSYLVLTYLGFGSISILMQIKTIIHFKINYKKWFMYRCMHILLSNLLLYIINILTL